MSTEEEVAAHYGSVGIADRVLAALRAAHGEGAAVTAEALAPFDQFHARGATATQELAALLKPQPGELLLDIGSGIGGPARWMATRFGVDVTGVDLTAEFCAAAETLNRLAGLADRVHILNGSALALPVPDAAFDAAYSQNVVMNIADKGAFYREAHRALRPGGRLALSNVCAGAGEPYFPVPWATTGETSFLATPAETREGLLAAGFEIAVLRDTTAAIIELQRRGRVELQRGTAPPAAADLIFGARAREMQINSRRGTEDGRTLMIEALAHKP